MQRALTFPGLAATCLCVLAFALLQPILDLLQRYPEFLSVHGLERARLLGFTLGLAVVPAILLAAAAWLLARAHRDAGIAFMAILVGSSVAVALLMPLSRGGATAAVGFGVAGIAGIAAGILFSRREGLRRGLGWGWPAAPLFVAIFLFQPSIRPLWLVGGEASRSAGDADGALEIPIVFAVFDALPLSSLLDVGGEVDAAAYPSFHRISMDGIWFRQHTTSAERTLKSLPAILTGRRPPATAQPILREHPRNLFTLLADSHDLHVWEAITRLAPEATGASGAIALGEVFSDLGVLYARALLPESMRRSLPPVDMGWRGFQWGQAGRGADSNRMVRGWRDFVAGISASEKPGLHFVHSILPHAPFLFTPTGQRYSRDGIEPSGQGDYTGVRNDDEWAAIHSYQRHLLQLAFVDTLLGELFDQLRRESIYDDALIIVTADHGVSFRRGVSGRLAGRENMPDILAVPLFVKLPGGERAGERVERGTESIDILPAIAALLAIDSGWEFDGRSLFDESLDRETKICLGHRGSVESSKAEAGAVEITVRERQKWFEHGLYAAGPHGALVGRPVSQFTIAAGAMPLPIRILRPSDPIEVEAGALLPAEVVGYISAAKPRAKLPHLAVAVDDVIRTVTHPYRPEKGRSDVVWSALLPEAALGDGTHRLEVFAIGEGDEEITLAPLATAGELPSFLGLRLGQRVVMGVEETGFRRHKPHGYESYRWTDPVASFEIPLRAGERPQSLRIKIAHAAPEGSTVRLSVNGRQLSVETVPDGGWEREFSVETLSFDGSARVEIESSSFVRDESVEGLPRPRVFGVALEGLWLQRRHVR